MYDYENIYTYLQFSNQKKAIRIASKYGITEDMFFKMKEEAGIINWTKTKREYMKQLEKNEIIVENIDENIVENIVQYEIIDGYGNIVTNDIIDEGNSSDIRLIFI
jgi:hypothetical protein